MTLQTRLYTVEEALDAFNDREEPWELVEGRIVPLTFPDWPHMRVVGFLYILLHQFEVTSGRGKAGFEMGLVTRRDPDSLRGPDVFFISNERIRERSRPFLTVMPELAVEVKSPSNTWPELHRKALEYLAAGVDRVWNVDAEGKRVRVYRGADDFDDLGEDDTIVGDGILDGLTIPVRDILASAQQ